MQAHINKREQKKRRDTKKCFWLRVEISFLVSTGSEICFRQKSLNPVGKLLIFLMYSKC
jgi:hypothetical protein